MLPTYRRLRDEGRMLPDGLTHIGGWVEPNFSVQYRRLLQPWTLPMARLRATFEMSRSLASGLARSLHRFLTARLTQRVLVRTSE
jgi:hypothetical protein